MAEKGSSKELSVRHEEHVAKVYEGKRSPSSGASVTDGGDVRCHDTLFECKCKKSEAKATLLSQFEKITDEAWAEEKEPAIALRFYSPDSLLADTEGWVDLVVRLLVDDANRTHLLREFEQI